MRHLTFIHRGEAGPEEIVITLDGSRCGFMLGGRLEEAEATRLPDGRLSLLFDDGRQICGRVSPRAGGEVEISTPAGVRRIALAEPLRDRLAHAAGDGASGSEDEEVRALMPGRVVEVLVLPGVEIAPGGLLLVLEAMKMQNEIRSVRGGRVLRVEVEKGKPVDGGALLVVLQAISAPDSGSGLRSEHPVPP
ncbi:MAG TPA: biotin/lipoyl-containing protein [Thermoanaerobaculia bacterium]|jgi:biotin carboxyl carrier protein|nr:biotin/lipoyl-containing protein [Thermoanaerobaculia bacterium]